MVSPVPKTRLLGASDECLCMCCKQSHVPCVPTLMQEVLEKPHFAESTLWGKKSKRKIVQNLWNCKKSSNKDSSLGDISVSSYT